MPPCSPSHHEAGKERRSARGFTMVEILIALAIVAILSSISVLAYKHYIDRAKVTVAISTMETTRTLLEDYHGSYATYPTAIDFTTGLDPQGRTVFSPAFLDEMRNHFASIDSYVPAGMSYTLTARAQDSVQSLLTLAPGSAIHVGP